jgi:hypothetical protein
MPYIAKGFAAKHSHTSQADKIDFIHKASFFLCHLAISGYNVSVESGQN